jgi:hypothetical protein
MRRTPARPKAWLKSLKGNSGTRRKKAETPAFHLNAPDEPLEAST